MKKIQIILLAFIITSCASSRVKIDKSIEISTNRIGLKVIIDKYLIKSGKYFGSITTFNKTVDTLIFNFNQAILVSGDTIYPDYNIKSISYAEQAFYIYPHATMTWDVIWKVEHKETDYSNIALLTDTTISTVMRLR